MKYKKPILTVVTCLAVLMALPALGHAEDWRHDDHRYRRETTKITIAPGLSIRLTDRDFANRWDRVDRGERGRFCRDVRRDCEWNGRYSRACQLKWRYCTPQHRDYGYYYNR